MRKEEGYFRTYDGINLFYRIWCAETLDHPVFIIHGLHEHSGRYGRIIEKLNLPGFSYFSFDARGHGLSPGKRGYALSVDEFLKDIDAFWSFVISRWPTMAKDRVIWLAHSFGGLLLVRYALKYPEKVKAIVLSAPCFGIRARIPYFDRIFGAIAPLFPNGSVNSLIVRRLLTHDPLERKLHKEDALIHNQTGLLLLHDMLEVMPQTVEEARNLKPPLLVLVSGNDHVVQNRVTHSFFEHAGSAEKQKVVFPKFYHELIREKEWERPFSVMREFLVRYSSE